MWGFWEGRHWKPRAALWRRDWSVKPNCQAWLDLVHDCWWTKADGRTDAAGSYQTRGFWVSTR
jgi:endo-1,4-beta-xylanase